MARNELYDRFCDGMQNKEKSPKVSCGNYIDIPSNDGDLDGAYRYLGWHMTKAGMSSTCFHYLEVLWKEATKKKIG